MTRVKKSLSFSLVGLALAVGLVAANNPAHAEPWWRKLFYTKKQCDEKFLAKEDADAFLTEAEGDAKYMTAEQAQAAFMTREEALALFLTTGAADARYVNDEQGEVNGDDIAVGTEVVGTNGGGPVFRATNTGQSGHGLYGEGNVGVWGEGHTVNGHYWCGVGGHSVDGPGVQGMSDNGFGGEFWGFSGLGLNVHGSFHCDGAKYAVVPMEDGTRRTVACIESPEVWFEDFGSGELVNGTALVEIEPLFLQTVNTQCEYHVFLTPEGDCRGLYVSAKTETSFAVRELQSGSSSTPFSYRIVAKRRGYETERLQIQEQVCP